MTTYAALLRGINVGGRHPVPMAGLRSFFDALGFADVRTHIQSGNVLFSSADRPDASALARALVDVYGFDIPVVVRAGDELRGALAHNPFPTLDHTKLHIGFLAAAPSDGALAELDGTAHLPERFAFVGSELYLFLPDGMARTKLPGYLDRRLKVAMTIRNWNTLTALVDLTNR
jgi:uncharacterized protein (DUF1697 family)